MDGARQSDCSRILVVDDLPEMRQLLGMVLEGCGHEVVRVGTGAEARQALQSHQFLLAIVDVNLPDCDGMELGTSMRTDDPGGTMKLMCITGDAGFADTLASPESPFDGCIIKPFGVAELLEEVKRLCGRQA